MAKRNMRQEAQRDSDLASRLYDALDEREKGAGRDGFFIASPRRLSFMTGIPVPTVREILKHFISCYTLEACPTRPCHFRLLRGQAMLHRAEQVRQAAPSSVLVWRPHPENNLPGVSGISPSDFNALMTRMMIDRPAPDEPGTDRSRPRPGRRRRAPAPAPPPGFGLPRSS